LRDKPPVKRDTRRLAIHIMEIANYIRGECIMCHLVNAICTRDLAKALDMYGARDLLRIAAAVHRLEELGLVSIVCSCLDKWVGFRKAKVES